MSFQSLTASRGAVPTSAAVVAPVSSAAVATSSARPATSAAAPTTQAAATTPATSAAAPATSAAAATSAAPPAASNSSSAAPAASSSSPPTSSSASVAPSSSNAPSSTSSPSPSSSPSSASRSSSASTSVASFVGSNAQTTGGSSAALPGSTIGAIAGGLAGGILLLALAFTCWRRMRGRRDRVPPPPPRDMTFNTSASTARARASSGAMLEKGLGLGAGGMNRGDSYATLLHNNPQAQMSRHPSYYNSYPVGTPSISNGSPPDTSPEVYPVEDAAVLGAVAASSGAAYAASASGRSTPGYGGLGDEPARPASRDGRRVPSVDRLRMEALATAGRGRPPSPSQGSLQFPSPHPAHYPLPEEPVFPGTATPPSPIYMSSSSGGSTSPMLGAGGYPRPASMSSLSSRGYNYLHVGPARGAPHQGRPIQLEMPRLLSDGGEAPSSPLSQTGEWGQKRYSGGLPPVHDYLPNPHPQSPTQPTSHRRAPSSQSLGSMSNQGRQRTSGGFQPALGPVP